MDGVILRGDAGHLAIAQGSVDCIVTLPPYNVAMPYVGVDDAMPPPTYRDRVARWAKEMMRVLKPGGRAWVNVPQALPVDGRPERETALRDGSYCYRTVTLRSTPRRN